MLEFLEEKLKNEYGQKISNEIFECFNTKRNTSFRINTIKSDSNEVENELKEKNISFSKLDFLDTAYILEGNLDEEITKLDIYKQGKIYVQSISSMIPPLILDIKEKENILDMCAAPGSKTTQMYDISKGRVYITACEKNKVRAEKLKFNLDKQGAKNVQVLNEDARFLSEYFRFDKILLDSPCSGSGTININDENIEEYFTEELIKRSSILQEKLLEKALKLLKRGSQMVYSTCSILKEENEDILKKFIDEKKIEIIPIDDKKYKKVPKLKTNIIGTLCVKPTKDFEGFFVAKIKKIN